MDFNKESIQPTFFATSSEFRSWLNEHHDTDSDLWVGFYKKSLSSKQSMTWSESVDEALCFGWIDGIRKRIDDDSYMIRFSLRKPNSKWSSSNIKRMEELIKLGRMKPSGLRIFERRSSKNDTPEYSYEQKSIIKLDHIYQQRFESNKAAWNFFQNQAESYQKAAVWWVMSAKKEETKKRRLIKLIEDSQNERTIPLLTRKRKSE